MSTIDDLFTYHAPNDRTLPRYKAIREAEAACRSTMRSAKDPASNLDRQAGFDLVNAACRQFYEAVERLAPASADTTTALRCIRLARMRANESIQTGVDQDWSLALTDARMWACAAIALGDAEAFRGRS